MSTRPRSEIMRDLKAILAELDFVMNEAERDAPDLSPKLAQALDRPIVPRHDEPETHHDIRAKARAYREETRDAFQASNREHMERRREHKDRLKDYSQVDDPDWPPDSTWMGTGDQKLIE